MDGRRARGHRRRTALMSSGVGLIARDGIDAVTHRAVASESGASLATVTYHFPTVVELKSAIFRWAGERVLEEMTQAAQVSAASNSDTAEVASAFAYRLCTAERDLAVVLLQLLVAAGSDEELRPVVEELNDRTASILAQSVDPAETPVVVASIQGVLLSALTRGADSAEWARDSVRRLVGQYTRTARSEDLTA